MTLPKLDNQKELAGFLKSVKLSDGEAASVSAEAATLYLRASNILLKNYNSFLREILREIHVILPR